jgi:hypothetical protein
MRLVLAVVVICLAMHFLVEDIVLFSRPAETMNSTASVEEWEHQDDLALIISLPLQIAPARIGYILPVSLADQVQIFFPHFDPPKI